MSSVLTERIKLGYSYQTKGWLLTSSDHPFNAGTSVGHGRGTRGHVTPLLIMERGKLYSSPTVLATINEQQGAR